MADRGKSLAPSQVSINEAITIVSENTIKIDPNKLPQPSALYDADYAWCLLRLGAVSLFFGKEDLNKREHLRTRLEVRFAPLPFLNHFWKNSREFHQKLREYAAEHPVEGRDKLTPETWEASKDHSEWVNLDYMAHSGHEACLDFYNLSARGVAIFARKLGSSGLDIAPVVRIQTTALELCHLLDSCEKIVFSLRNQFPDKEEEDSSHDDDGDAPR